MSDNNNADDAGSKTSQRIPTWEDVYWQKSARKAINAILANTGIKQTELAEAAGLNHSASVSAFLKGDNHALGRSSVQKIAHFLGADTLAELSNKAAEEKKGGIYSPEKAQHAILAVLRGTGIRQTELAEALGLSKSGALVHFLNGTNNALGISTVKKIAQFLGANTWSDLYKKGAEAENYSSEKAQRAISALLDSKGIKRDEFAAAIDLPVGTLRSYLSERNPDYYIIGIAKVHKIANVLGATTWNDLYEKGAQAEKIVGVYSHEKVQRAIVAIFDSKGLNYAELAQAAGLSNSTALKAFLDGKNYTLSLSSIRKIVQFIGATTWNDLYEKGAHAEKVFGFYSPENVRHAFHTLLMRERATVDQLALALELKPSEHLALTAFLTPEAPDSHTLDMPIIKKIMHSFGAENWAQLYAMAASETALPPKTPSVAPMTAPQRIAYLESTASEADAAMVNAKLSAAAIAAHRTPKETEKLIEQSASFAKREGLTDSQQEQLSKLRIKLIRAQDLALENINWARMKLCHFYETAYPNGLPDGLTAEQATANDGRKIKAAYDAIKPPQEHRLYR